MAPRLRSGAPALFLVGDRLHCAAAAAMASCCAKMAYLIGRDEEITAAIERIVTERLDAARARLLDDSAAPPERVHDARKRFKEARAAVRLIREPLGDAFAVENTWLRDAGRSLAAIREQDALVETLDRLLEGAETQSRQEAIITAASRARTRRRRMGVDAVRKRMSRAAARVPDALARILRWPDLPAGFAAIARGLERTYTDGQNAFLESAASPAPETLHEWRKRVKDHWYHTQLLRECGGDVLRERRERMEALSDALGQRHDLDVLAALLRRHPGRFGNSATRASLRALLAERSAALTAEALAIGTMVYRDAPAALVDRFEAAWLEWRR